MNVRAIPAFLLAAVACGAPTVDPGPDGILGTDDDVVVDPKDTDDTSPAGVDSPQVDPTCTDGQYTEVLPDNTGDISGIIAGFDDFTQFTLDVLAVRYPVGVTLVEGGLDAPRLGNCITQFTSPQQRNSASGMLQAMSTLTHECGHFHDIASSGRGNAYQVNADLMLTCSNGSYTEVPARSRITGDAYNDLRPPCPASGSYGCDSYAQLYLDGDPDNARFESGDQGIDMLMEEVVQYIHSLATERAFLDQIGRGASTSARDGILTFLWYTERYLRWVRQNDAAAYDALMGRQCWRDLILTAWGRSWLYLEATDGERRLGIDDADLMDLVLDPDLLGEIQRVRDAQGCP